MADVQYLAGNVAPPSGQLWNAAFQWINSRVLTAGTEIIVTNSDGSITLITGTGLTIGADGEPTGGTVNQIERRPAGGITTYELYFFVTSPPTLIDLRSQGVGEWFLMGEDNISDNGNAIDDTLIGGAGKDFLQGGDKDKMLGGTGDDYYLVSTNTVSITEIAGSIGGTDTVDVGDNIASFTLGANLEILTHQGHVGAFKGTGNALDNTLIGGIENDTLTGLGGNDTLTGWEGVDTLIGGLGNDVYHVYDVGDKAVESSNQGKDKISLQSFSNGVTSYILPANVEDLEFENGLFIGAFNITGNSLDNKISGVSVSGDVLTGLGGNDTLNGVFGTDTLTGGLGNDTYIDPEGNDTITELAGQGIDTVETADNSYTLPNNVENLVLTAGGAAGFGNTLANVLTLAPGGGSLFGSDGNDTLDARAGFASSFLSGGKGNDTYIVDDISDTTNENSNAVGEGTADTVQSAATSLVLQAFIENGTIIEGAIGQTRSLTGNVLTNILTGDISDDSLDGGSGGEDALLGGKGNDTYNIDSIGDKVTELAGAGSGIDTVKILGTAFASYTLGTNVENFDGTLTGAAISVTGNALSNKITGTSFSGDKLVGLGGNDELWGHSGVDTLVGGLGNDTYVLLDTFDNFDVITELAGQGTDTVKTDLATLDLTSAAKYANIENITGTGGGAHTFTGSSGNNVITGDVASDGLSGGLGNDTLLGLGSGDTLFGDDGNDTIDGGIDGVLDNLFGGDGNDTYIVDESMDFGNLFDSSGTDTIKTALGTVDLVASGVGTVENLTYTGAGQFTGTGNALSNIITGGLLDDTLDGGGGGEIDTFVGLKGNDTYIVDNLADKITEKAGEGTDEIKTALATYTLGANAANVENLTFTGAGKFTGTGNDLNNLIIGGADSDKLFGGIGNDTLDGGGFSDEMTGGTGNDTYVVNNGNDKVIELAGQGTDTIKTDVGSAYTLDTANLKNVENLTYVGASMYALTGNALNNVLTGGALFDNITGGAGNDTLDGGGDADGLTGGTGNDLYRVDNALDAIFENAGEGTADKAEVTVAGALWTMANNLEIASFTGAGNFLVMGNGSNNIITGGAGDDEIDGAAGADTMTGLGGDDTYTVDVAGDKVVEAGGGGKDTVETALGTYTLGANLENLTITSAGTHTGTGNTLDNILTGDAGDDTLIGLAGKDQLSGGGGTNKLIGGLGDDDYFISSATDTITELAGQGTDSIRTTLNTFDMSAKALNVENLVFNGAGGFIATGNANANDIQAGSDNDQLNGDAGNDILRGLAGDDKLTGGLGNDTLWGGLDNDTFVFTAGAGQGNDVIIDFNGVAFAADDVISIASDIVDFNQLVNDGHVIQQANGTLLQLDATTSILILGYKAADLAAGDFQFI